jgi:uncharacterized protein (TIGR02996 family)
VSREEESLIAAVCAEPDDDAPRLVYADWLDENARAEHAELIRVMVRVERVPDDDPQRRGLVWRARELLSAHENELRLRLPKKAQEFTCHFRRGFVNRIHGTAARFVKNGEAIARQVPLEEATLHRLSGRAADLAATPALGRLRGLRFFNVEAFSRSTHLGLIDVLDSPHLGRLTRLDFERAELLEDGAEALAKKPSLARLTALRPGRLDHAGLGALMRSPHLANLTSLDLSNNRFSADGLAALTGAEQLGRLTDLNLNYAGLDLGGFERLAAWPGMERLTSLDVSSNFHGDTGLRLLTRGCRVPRLRSLNVANNNLTSASVEELLHWPGLDHLTRLDVGHNEIEPEALGELLRSPRCARLAWLGPMGDFDEEPEQARRRARVLAEAPGLERLHTLDAIDLDLQYDDPDLRRLQERFSPWAFCGHLWEF